MSVGDTIGLLVVAVATLSFAGASAESSELERLQRELRIAAPPEQYPDHAEYRLFPKLCNARICFKVLAVRFAAYPAPIVRLAIFSESAHYIGSYEGLKLMPTKVAGPVLHFPATTHANGIRFDRTSPPAKIRIDGESHAFERAR